jgi:cellulose synthase/poly-beta-1,6-N-acetylglucosamine synthase-like glycosyltransferase
MHWFPVILILPYFFLLLKIYRSLLKIKTFDVTDEAVIYVSVVVACRNEQENLPLLLKSLAEQDYPKDLSEVIIVDDNSTDRTFEISSDFTGNFNIITINNNGKGKKQAIRCGINASSGTLLITTDADCRMGKSWIRTIASFYEKHKPDMIICPVQIEPGPGFFVKFQELEFLSLQGVTAGSAFSGEATMCNGANLAFTRKSYLNHSDNLHDEIASGDDIFFMQSLKKDSQSKLLWLESPDAMVTTVSSISTRSFMKQRSKWISKGKAYNDRFTIVLGIVTFVTIIMQVSVLFAGFYNSAFIAVFLTIFLLKSVPDFLILLKTSGRYGRRDLMFWFLPVQIIYPFYVLSVVCYSLYPFRKPEI